MRVHCSQTTHQKKTTIESEKSMNNQETPGSSASANSLGCEENVNAFLDKKPEAMRTVSLNEIELGESLAYTTPQGYAFAGDYFHAAENGLLVVKNQFACGAVRFNRHTPKGWGVIRGTEVFPIS